jgi:predicted MFS family arabinose efflux permease
LFCFSFLVWLTERTQRGHEAATQGWFFLALSGGNQILGNSLAAFLLERAGPIVTLWTGLAIAVIGGAVGLVMTRDPTSPSQRARVGDFGGGLSDSFSILVREPRIAAGGIIKMINVGGVVGMYVLYVPYLTNEIGISTSQAVYTFMILGATGVPGNLLWGYVSDRMGWANTVQWVACPINMIAIALLYLVPRWCGAEFAPVAGIMLLWGVGTSAFSPLAALMAAITPHEVGNALGVFNFASGVAMIAGPALVGALLGVGGYGGVMATLVSLYLVAFLLMFYVQLPGRARTSANLPINAQIAI